MNSASCEHQICKQDLGCNWFLWESQQFDGNVPPNITRYFDFSSLSVVVGFHSLQSEFLFLEAMFLYINDGSCNVSQQCSSFQSYDPSSVGLSK